MNIENIISFIKYGVNETLTRDKIQASGVAFCFLACLSGFFGFYYGIVEILCSTIVYISSVIFIVFLCRASQNLTIKNRVMCYAANTVYATFSFSLITYSFLHINGHRFLLWISVLPIVIGGISFLFSYIKCKNNMYLKKKNRSIFLDMATFGAIGFAISRLLDLKKLLGTYEAEVLMAFFSIIIASALALTGAPTLLKLHYIKKLEKANIFIDKR